MHKINQTEAQMLTDPMQSSGGLDAECNSQEREHGGTGPVSRLGVHAASTKVHRITNTTLFFAFFCKRENSLHIVFQLVKAGSNTSSLK